MGIHKFGVTVADVVRPLPIDGSEVTAGTELSIQDVEEYILDNSASFIGLLQQGGVSDEGSLDEVSERQAKTYVVSSSVADCLDQMGMSTAPGYQRYRDRAEAIYGRYSSRPQTLKKQVSQAKYSGDKSAPLKRDFTGKGYEF